MTNLDGRWLVVGCLLAYGTFLFATHFFVDYRRVWSGLGVPAATPNFADLRGVLTGAESLRDGFDPIVNNPHDPAGRPSNYPHVWFRAILMLNLDRWNPVMLGVGLALAFYVCVLMFTGRIDLREGVIWSLLLCAPPTMLAVERGNNDLVVFDLLALALVVRRYTTFFASTVCYALIEGCAMLKFYPIIAFCLALRSPPKIALTILSISGLVFGLYLYAIHDQLKAISAVLLHPTYCAYGSHVIADWYRGHHPGAPGFLSRFMPPLAVLVILFLAVLGTWHCPRLPAMPRGKMDGLMVGTSLYVFSFVASSSYNYRLIFVLFAIPALLHLLKEPGFYHRFATVLSIFLAVGWVLSPRMEWPIFLLKEAANWIVFAGMTFFWLECLPTPSDFWRLPPRDEAV